MCKLIQLGASQSSLQTISKISHAGKALISNIKKFGHFSSPLRWPHSLNDVLSFKGSDNVPLFLFVVPFSRRLIRCNLRCSARFLPSYFKWSLARRPIASNGLIAVFGIEFPSIPSVYGLSNTLMEYRIVIDTSTIRIQCSRTSSFFRIFFSSFTGVRVNGRTLNLCKRVNCGDTCGEN